MIKEKNNDIVTRHFDIFKDIVILDLPVENELWLITYKKHKLVEKLIWKLN